MGVLCGGQCLQCGSQLPAFVLCMWDLAPVSLHTTETDGVCDYTASPAFQPCLLVGVSVALACLLQNVAHDYGTASVSMPHLGVKDGACCPQDHFGLRSTLRGQPACGTCRPKVLDHTIEMCAAVNHGNKVTGCLVWQPYMWLRVAVFARKSYQEALGAGKQHMQGSQSVQSSQKNMCALQPHTNSQIETLVDDHISVGIRNVPAKILAASCMVLEYGY